MKAKDKKGVVRTAKRAIAALMDLHEDSHSVAETRDAARGYLLLMGVVCDIENFIKQIESK